MIKVIELFAGVGRQREASKNKTKLDYKYINLIYKSSYDRISKVVRGEISNEKI